MVDPSRTVATENAEEPTREGRSAEETRLPHGRRANSRCDVAKRCDY
jgi:hypothetical protein